MRSRKARSSSESPSVVRAASMMPMVLVRPGAGAHIQLPASLVGWQRYRRSVERQRLKYVRRQIVVFSRSRRVLITIPVIAPVHVGRAAGTWDLDDPGALGHPGELSGRRQVSVVGPRTGHGGCRRVKIIVGAPSGLVGANPVVRIARSEYGGRFDASRR